jgi:ATP synthase protein I
MGQAMKIAIELVVGIAVGGFIGKVLDDQFGTRPWLLIVFLMLGFAAGILNIVRTARRLQAEAEPLQRSAKSVPDDEEDDGK